MNCSVDATTARQAGIGGIHDCIHLLPGDITLMDFNRGVARVPICGHDCSTFWPTVMHPGKGHMANRPFAKRRIFLLDCSNFGQSRFRNNVRNSSSTPAYYNSVL